MGSKGKNTITDAMMNQTNIDLLFGSRGHLTEEGMALYVDALKLGRMDALPGTILDHVQRCQQCKEEITGLYALVADQDYSGTGPHPFFDSPVAAKSTDGRYVFRIAATIVAVIGLGALAYILFLRSPGGNVEQQPVLTETRADTTVRAHHPEKQAPSVNTQELIAARFVESPELEDLVQNAMRSEEATVRAPVNGSTISPGTKFIWTTSAHPPFELSILDNQRHTVRSFRMSTTEFVLRDSLAAGRYYWKLGAEGNLLHVGKFIVR
jgi:hypothetical protein